jgi:ribonuclease D
MEQDINLRTITKQEIAAMEPVSFAGRIIVIQTEAEAQKAVAYLRTLRFIGFDTETRPAFRKGQVNKVALLQLSGDECCFLFRLNIIGLPECVVDLLRDPKVLKVGLSIKDDYMTMHRMAPFEPQGFVELQNFVKQFGIGEASLQKIYGILFGRKISKSQRLSNWEADTLTEAQKKYAATDAWACYRIFDTLNNSK